jgi:hypothetical protein
MTAPGSPREHSLAEVELGYQPRLPIPDIALRTLY